MTPRYMPSVSCRCRFPSFLVSSVSTVPAPSTCRRLGPHALLQVCVAGRHGFPDLTQVTSHLGEQISPSTTKVLQTSPFPHLCSAWPRRRGDQIAGCGTKIIITLGDWLGFCGLTGQEVLAIAEYEHLPEVTAAALAQYLSLSKNYIRT
jgi:hypothetical protein